MSQSGTANGYVRANPLIAGHGDLDAGFIFQALQDGIIYRTRLAAEPCQDCLAHPSLMCESCQAVMDLASVYRMLAAQFRSEQEHA